ncbi:MAG: class I SAM-dependent methyltransferase [Kiritimatiellae bacterium]|nr:class I SAM-dependent methyltransferase [Kiritimatiellia bacterium]
MDDDQTTRSKRDMELFDRIANSYIRKDQWGPSRRARALRLMQSIRYARTNADTDILEVGCGAGFSARYLQNSCRTYTGIDYSADLIEHAKQLNATPNALFQSVNFYEFNTETRYDLILMIGVLHHMNDIPRALKTAKQLLKPGGSLVVNEPQPANPLFSHLRKLRTKVDSSYSCEQQELSAIQLHDYFQKAEFSDIAAYPQGLFSTPFAEIILKPHWLMNPLSALCCGMDRILEKHAPRMLQPITWNTIVTGRSFQ